MKTVIPRMSERDYRFLTFQVCAWSAYGAILMLPWIGVYSIAVMLPNKIAIAGTGLATSSVLRLLYRSARERRPSPDRLVMLAAGASVAGGIVWSGLSGAMLGADLTRIWSSIGTLSGGLPHLGGPLYSALVLLAWSLAYLTMTAVPARVTATRPAIRPAVRVTERSAADGLITARDGDKTFVIDPRELAWVNAEGDYVRLHTDKKSLLIRTTMTQLESVLPAGTFVRIHRSTIVNVARVREVIPRANSELSVVLRDGTRLKASRTYADRLRSALEIDARGSYKVM